MIFLIMGLFLAAIFGLYSFFLIRRSFRFFNLPKTKLILALNIFLPLVIAYFCRDMRSLVGIVLLQILFLSMLLDLVHLIFTVVEHCKNHNEKTNLTVVEHCRNHNEHNEQKSCKIFTILSKLYHSAFLSIIFVLPFNIFGYCNLQNLNQTEYEVLSPKLKNDYKVIFMSDFHWGTIQKKSVFKEKIEEINSQNADFIILGGDIVEEGTSKDDMKEIFALCSNLKSRYGTFFIFGNHDPQQYSRNKTYSMEELRSEIQKNGIKILEDEVIPISDDLLLIGRLDFGFRNEKNRASMKSLLQNQEKSKFLLVADHQPKGKEENSTEKVDLQLSGHTHAGQIFPIGRIMNLFSYTYGEYDYNGLKTIVSSGVAGWGYKVRTEKLCEYVVVKLEKK